MGTKGCCPKDFIIMTLLYTVWKYFWLVVTGKNAGLENYCLASDLESMSILYIDRDPYAGALKITSALPHAIQQKQYTQVTILINMFISS